MSDEFDRFLDAWGRAREAEARAAPTHTPRAFLGAVRRVRLVRNGLIAGAGALGLAALVTILVLALRAPTPEKPAPVYTPEPPLRAIDR